MFNLLGYVVILLCSVVYAGNILKGPHVCERLVKNVAYETKHLTKIVTETYSTCCERFILCMRYCNKQRYKRVNYTKLVSSHSHQILRECCDGWKEDKLTCVPVCKPPCVHGKCTQPDFCVCEKGYHGNYCQNTMVNTNSGEDATDINYSNYIWSWLVPTIIFIIIVIVVVVFYRRRRTSVYKVTHLVQQSNVRYKSFQDEEDGAPKPSPRRPLNDTRSPNWTNLKNQFNPFSNEYI